MSAKYRAAIIACGNIARVCHLPAYRKIKGVEFVAGADPSPAIRAAWQQELGVPAMYADPEWKVYIDKNAETGYLISQESVLMSPA